jgi:hypothetical protein
VVSIAYSPCTVTSLVNGILLCVHIKLDVINQCLCVGTRGNPRDLNETALPRVFGVCSSFVHLLRIRNSALRPLVLSSPASSVSCFTQ